MALQITLPRLVGTREAADALVSETLGDTADGTAVVLGGALATSTISFADELIVKLRDCGISQILMVAANEKFQQQMLDAAKRHMPIDVRPANADELARI